MVQDSMGLLRITLRREVKTEDKTCFAVDDEPDVVLDAVDFDDSFVSVPLVGVEVHRGNELEGDVVEQRRELFAPCSDSYV